MRVSELQRGRVSFSIDRPWPIMPPLPPVRRSEPQWGQGRCGSFLLEHAKKLKLFRRGYNVATGSRHSRVGLDHSRCHGPPKTQTAGRVLCGKRRGTIILSSAAREQAWRIFQQHRNAFIRSRINSSNWGTGPCPLWAFLQLCCRLYLHSPGCSGAHLPSSIQSREECRWCISSARALARCNATTYHHALSELPSSSRAQHRSPACGELVFATRTGKPQPATNIHHHVWVPLLVKCGLTNEAGEHRYHFHLLRHAAASLFIAYLKWPPKRIQAVMGHGRITMTFDLYGHLFENVEADREDMKKLEAAVRAA